MWLGCSTAAVYSECSLSAWLKNAPRHLLANNFGMPEAGVAKFRNEHSPIKAAL